MRASWQRHIFPEGFPSSIVCAGAFHFRVRDGNGWFHSAKVTRKLSLDSIAYPGKIVQANALGCLVKRFALFLWYNNSKIS